ncbi:MAG: hypothetical protein V4568_00565 [Pseudomonadota bacterium]
MITVYWDPFDVSGYPYRLKAKANGKWVSAEMNYGSGDQYMLRARADRIADWERFMLPVSARACYELYRAI